MSVELTEEKVREWLASLEEPRVGSLLLKISGFADELAEDWQRLKSENARLRAVTNANPHTNDAVVECVLGAVWDGIDGRPFTGVASALVYIASPECRTDVAAALAKRAEVG